MPEINENNKSLGELEEELSKIKSASELIQDAKDTAEKTISETKTILSDLIKNSKKATDSAIKESKKLNNAATEVFIVVDDLMNKLDKVDFPIRLDKLDTTVSGINSSIQNVLGRFDSVERNLKDDLKIILYLLIGILVVLCGSFFGLFYKMGFFG